MNTRSIGASVSLALALLVTGTVAQAAQPANAGSASGGDHKTTICHDGKTLSVGDPAVAAHLAHGDTVGACKKATGNRGGSGGTDNAASGQPGNGNQGGAKKKH